MTQKLQQVQVLNWCHFWILLVQKVFGITLFQMTNPLAKTAVLPYCNSHRGGAVTTARFLTTKNRSTMHNIASLIEGQPI